MVLSSEKGIIKKYHITIQNFLKKICATARVWVGRKFSSDWGDMCNLAFIAATILNFWLAWPGWQSYLKIQNCGGNDC